MKVKQNVSISKIGRWRYFVQPDVIVEVLYNWKSCDDRGLPIEARETLRSRLGPYICRQHAEGVHILMTGQFHHNSEEWADLNKPENQPRKAAPEQSDEEPLDIFAPPPPKAAIFHRVDNPDSVSRGGDLQGSGSYVDASDEAKTPVAPRKSGLDFIDRDDTDPLGQATRGTFSEMAWTRHPVTVAIVVALLLLLYFGPYDLGIPRFALYIIVGVISAYWLAPWHRYQYRYNMDWQADADPTGCLYSGWRWWR
jgi:hypothetical protein